MSRGTKRSCPGDETIRSTVTGIISTEGWEEMDGVRERDERESGILSTEKLRTQISMSKETEDRGRDSTSKNY